jgi:peptide-methionine (S)-S-oxide reductase
MSKTDLSLSVSLLTPGCFLFLAHQVEGVVSTTSGYTGGKEARPNYNVVSSGATGHAEAMEVVYDPSKVSYAQLLDIFWHQVGSLIVERVVFSKRSMP